MAPKNELTDYKGFKMRVIREVDEPGEPDYLTMTDRYDGVDADQRAEYEAQDAERLAAFTRGDWYYMYVGVELFIPTKQNWAALTRVGRAYLHGIESDSEESYFNEVAKELADEAYDDARCTFEALQGVFQK